MRFAERAVVRVIGSEHGCCGANGSIARHVEGAQVQPSSVASAARLGKKGQQVQVHQVSVPHRGTAHALITAWSMVTLNWNALTVGSGIKRALPNVSSITPRTSSPSISTSVP